MSTNIPRRWKKVGTIGGFGPEAGDGKYWCGVSRSRLKLMMELIALQCAERSGAIGWLKDRV